MPLRKKFDNFSSDALRKVNEYWLEDASFVLLLAILCLLIFILPILQEFSSYAVYFNYSIFIFLYFSGIFSCFNYWIMIFLFCIFVVYLFLKINRIFLLDNSMYPLELIVSLISLIFMIFNNIRLLFRDEEVTFYRIIGAINVYLLFSVYGAVFLMLLNQFFPPILLGNVSLKGDDSDYAEMIYFSLTSLTTVGFGEIYTTNVIARQLSVFLSTFGMLYPGLVIAKLLNKTK